MSKFNELEIVISSKCDKKPSRMMVVRLWFLCIGLFIQRVIIQSIKDTYAWRRGGNQVQPLTPWPPPPPMVEQDAEVKKYLDEMPADERIHHCGTCGGRLDE